MLDLTSGGRDKLMMGAELSGEGGDGDGCNLFK